MSTFTTGAVVKVASGKHIFLLTISIAVHWCPTTNIFCGRRASNLSLAGRHIRANPPISRVIPLEQRMQHPVANRASPRLAPSSATYFHFSILALYTELRFLAAPTAPRQSSPNRREMSTRQDSRVDAAELLLSAHRKRSWFVWTRAASNSGVYSDSKDYYEQLSHLSLCILLCCVFLFDCSPPNKCTFSWGEAKQRYVVQSRRIGRTGR